MPRTTDTLAKEIDALGLLQEHVESARRLIRDFENRLGVVRDKLVADDLAVKNGRHFFVEVEAEGRTVRAVKDMPRLAALLGSETFLRIARVNLVDIDRHLTGDQKEQVLDVSRSETRAITLHKRV